MVSKGMGLSQYAPKGVKSLCITSSQTVYVRKPDLVLCKTQERLGGRPICEIYLNTYFQRARLGGRLICEIGLYASIYGTCLQHMNCGAKHIDKFLWQIQKTFDLTR